MKYKRSLSISILLALSFMMTIFTVIYIVDPYMIFHKKIFYKNKMSPNLRIQNYGLIKFENFDSIIMGTSMLENTSADEASAKLNSTFANLSISGGSFYEKFLILNYAIKTKKIKNIILSLDFKFEIDGEINNTFLPQLYNNDSVLSKFSAYLNTNAMKCIFWGYCELKDIDLDHSSAWYKNGEHMRRFGGFNKWLEYRNSDTQIKQAFIDLKSEKFMSNINFEKGKKIIDTEILPLFQNSNVQFNIIIPPYSILWWAKADDYSKILEIYGYFIEQASLFYNVSVYWFYDEDFVLDVANYKDLTHYHQSFNSLQLDAIKHKNNIINGKNYKAKFNEWTNSIETFDLDFYLNQI